MKLIGDDEIMHILLVGLAAASREGCASQIYSVALDRVGVKVFGMPDFLYQDTLINYFLP
jgi:hydrogenase/urease accessory protein HupE